MKKTLFILSFLTVSTTAFCQEVKQGGSKDSLSRTSIQPELSNQLQGNSSSSGSSLQPMVNLGKDLPSSIDQPKINPKAVEIKQTSAGPATWDNGMLMGYHGSVGSTFSYSNIAGANVFQQWGNLSLMGGLSLSKGVYNGLGIVNAVNTNLLLGYQLNDNLLLNAFGSIGNAGFLSNAPALTNIAYGGYLTLMTNNQKWGMDMGVRRVYNSMTGTWETIPIAMPYYNLGGAKLGIDIGGLLYGIFHKAVYKYDPKSGNYDPRRGPAIIAPPVAPMPHFDTIETPKWAEDQYPDRF